MSKSIIVTGGSRGIGAATARLAGERGWSVAVNFVGNEAAARETATAVEHAGGKALVIRGDVADEDDVVRLFDEAAAAFGGIDGVVSNAGIVDASMPLVDMTAARIRRIVDVNLTGACLVAREAARRMAKGRGGRGGALVNLSSIAARLGAPNFCVEYAAAKGGVESLTVGLARELGPEGIRVNAVRPGTIDTDIHISTGHPEWPKKAGSVIPLGRAGTADEVAETIVWLLSDAASYVSGAILEVSGAR